MVASQGGHLAQMTSLGLGAESTTIAIATSVGPQLTALPTSWRLHAIADVHPRDYRGLLKALVPAWRVVRRSPATVVVSTGAGIALAFMPAAVLLHRRAVYLESATRMTGPSLTGRLLSRTPGVTCISQYAGWRGRWQHYGNVFEAFRAEPTSGPTAPATFLVLLGTQERFQARRLVEGVLRALPADARVTWQLGGTTLDDVDLPGDVHRSIPADDLADLVRKVDVVISHGGVGSALLCLQEGRVPVLLPRRVKRDEHIDDHQLQLCEYLEGLGLAVARDADELSYTDLQRATEGRAVARTGPLTLDRLIRRD
jgi:UDP-N-acetylglucosamine transferase subunit ALG13